MKRLSNQTTDMEQLLRSEYIEDLRKHFPVSSVHFMVYDYPFQHLDLDNNEDPNGHLNTSEGTPKVLTYLNSDNSNKAI